MRYWADAKGLLVLPGGDGDRDERKRACRTLRLRFRGVTFSSELGTIGKRSRKPGESAGHFLEAH